MQIEMFGHCPFIDLEHVVDYKGDNSGIIYIVLQSNHVPIFVLNATIRYGSTTI